MSEQPEYEIILTTRHRAECLEARLVLEAVGISTQAMRRQGWWLLIVHQADVAKAGAELEDYRAENADRKPQRSRPIPIYDGALPAMGMYAAIIIVIHIQQLQFAYGLNWLEIGSMQAGQVTAGQWWRTITALTLHADVEHLASNLVFGGVFGYLAGRILGGGVAWLVIVLAGALGNLINAIVQAPEHTSIGASTAVFAALGVLVAHALRPRETVEEKLFKRWAPLIGGVVIFGFTGMGGERTDVLAHVTGFSAGMLLGWVGCRIPNRLLADQRVQWICAIATIVLVIAAWLAGIFNSNG